MEIIKSIIKIIGSQYINHALVNITLIFSIAGIVFTGIMAYLYFIRDLKFSIIKKLIEEDHENRKLFSLQIIKFKNTVLQNIIKTRDKNIVINEIIIEESINEWKEIYNNSQSLSSELANIVHLMYLTLLIVKENIGKEKNRLNFVDDFYHFYLEVIDLLLVNCQKMKLFPSILAIIFGFNKNNVYSKQVNRITDKSDLKTTIISDIGINTGGSRKEILAFTMGLVNIRNPLLSFSLAECYNLNTYLARVLCLSKLCFLNSFSIDGKLYSKIQFKLFRFERNIELGSNEQVYIFYYTNNACNINVTSENNFLELRKTKDSKKVIVFDELTKYRFTIPINRIFYSKIYDTNMVKIRIYKKDIKCNFIKLYKVKKLLKKRNLTTAST